MARGPLAGAAGPGKFSVRSDGMNLPSQYYGEGVETKNLMQGAKMSTTPDVSAASPSAIRQAAAGQVTPLYAPSQRPDEPITAGAPMGPGPGPEALGINNIQDTEEERNRLISYLPALEAAAFAPNSSQAFRNYVRMLRANLL